MNIKTALIAAVGMSLSSFALAESHLLTLDGSTSFELTGTETVTFELELDQPYSEITKACLTIETNDDELPTFPTPGSVFIEEQSEAGGMGISIGVPFAVAVGYEIINPETGESETYPSSISDPTVCLNFAQQNLKDGYATIDLKYSGESLKIDSLKLDVEGTPSELLFSLTNQSNRIFYPKEGGTLIYDAKLGNYDSDFGSKRFRIWSVVTMPDGTSYPVMKKKGHRLYYGEELEFSGRQFKIPRWFPEGNYKLSWYVVDNKDESSTIHSSSLNFFKSNFE